jgi:hypothetical protein
VPLFRRKRDVAPPVAVGTQAVERTESDAAVNGQTDFERAQGTAEQAQKAYEAALAAEAPGEEMVRLAAVWSAAEEDLRRLLTATALSALATLAASIAHVGQDYREAALAYIAAAQRNEQTKRRAQQMMSQQPSLETDAEFRHSVQIDNEYSAAYAGYEHASDAFDRASDAWQKARDTLSLSLSALDEEDIASRRTDALASFEPGSYSVVVSRFASLVVPFSEETSADLAAIYLAARLGLTTDEAAMTCKRVAHIGSETVLLDVSLDDAIKVKDELIRLGAEASLSEGATTAAESPSRQAIPERVRHEVWRRDQGRCVDCGSRERLEFDHIVPVAKGGANTARNIELRCEPCNRKKAARV